MMRDGYEFDLVTQRFLRNRWETEIGSRVLEEIIEGIKRGVEIRAILDRYVLNHADNQDPYGHPYYPKDAMTPEAFWVLTQDDLRGIHVYHETFPNNSSFSVKSLNYARFYGCTLAGANLERTGLTETTFEKCNLSDVCFADAGGYGTTFVNCNLEGACFWMAGLIESNFSGSNLRGAYFESAKLQDIIVDYHTTIDRSLARTWETRSMPVDQLPDLLRAIRIGYERAELWPQYDEYLYLERKENRKIILWKRAKEEKLASSFWDWFKDLAWGITAGYGVKPGRLVLFGLLLATVFGLTYLLCGNPEGVDGFTGSLYFSLTTFTTLGYGDVVYSASRWIMRLITATEALIGAVVVATLVAVLTRKLIRY